MKKFLRRTGLTALIVLCSLSLAALHIGLYIAAAEEGYVQNITLRETAAGELSITVSYRNIPGSRGGDPVRGYRRRKAYRR